MQLADVLILADKKQEAIGLLIPLADQFARDGFAAKAVSVLKKIQKVDPGRRDVEERLARQIEERQREATSLPLSRPGGSGSDEPQAGFGEGPALEIGFEMMAPVSAPVPPPARSAEGGGRRTARRHAAGRRRAPARGAAATRAAPASRSAGSPARRAARDLRDRRGPGRGSEGGGRRDRGLRPPLLHPGGRGGRGDRHPARGGARRGGRSTRGADVGGPVRRRADGPRRQRVPGVPRRGEGGRPRPPLRGKSPAAPRSW